MAVRDHVAYILHTADAGRYALTAIDLRSGERHWRHEFDSEPSAQSDTGRYAFQLVIAGGVVVMQVRGDGDTLLALTVPSRTVAWEQPDLLIEDPDARHYSNVSAIDDEYLVLTPRAQATGATNGVPNDDESLRVALYRLADGELLWTAREGNANWPVPETNRGTCRVVPG